MDHPARQYYNPQLTADEERVLLRRNYLLNQTGQAALGLIGPHLRGIAVEPRPDAIVVHFAITARTAEVEEDLDDIIFELEVFLGGGPEQRSEITAEVHVGRTDATWPGRRHALLYVAKPEAGREAQGF
ncbi:hypothetical protein [Streptomyces sp. NBC_00151]|uniref:Uncharacterized protein n=1 Tax=Streptomyces sp. NBC_01393 TaxID=2903851 RepID=A0AAU3IBT1_9ACTN|nr:hypothetical protein [Streptomyces sp. NBC_00151]WRZ44625.1 hypothetical protein OG915_45530 [Streptomyces sp. NBC_00151]